MNLASKTNKRVVIVGSFPPPYGGNSVHVRRLSALLSEIYDVRVIDVNGSPVDTDPPSVIRCGTLLPLNLAKACFYLRTREPQIAHFHVSAMKNFVIAGNLLIRALPRSCKRMITIHSGSFVSTFHSGGWLKAQMSTSLLRGFDCIIVVNDKQRELLVEIGCVPERVFVLPAFLPPLAVASPVVVELIKRIAGAGKQLLVSSGYGQEHYGYHHIADALELLGDHRHDMHLVLCVYNTYNERYLETVERALRRVVDLTVCRDLSAEEFSYVLSKCDIYIRATDRDGDAVAIREAGYFGKQVVASDIVPRPEGTILFRLGDATDLANGIGRALANRTCGLISCDNEVGMAKLVRLYNSMEDSA